MRDSLDINDGKLKKDLSSRMMNEPVFFDTLEHSECSLNSGSNDFVGIFR